MIRVESQACPVSPGEILSIIGAPKGSLLAMYKFLADESGLRKPEESVCVVAGFVGTEEQWDALAAAWERVLSDFNVDCFHALDFWDWHLEDNGEVVRTHPYEGWTDGDDFEFINNLISAIEEAGLYKAGTAISIDRFFELTEDERRFLTTSALYDSDWKARGKPNDPWFAAFQSALLTATFFVPVGEKMYPIFDRRNSPDRHKQPEHDKAREVYNEMLDQRPPLSVRNRLGEVIAFSSMESSMGLQAADLLCNRSRAYITSGLGDDLLSNRLRDFIENGRGFVRMLGIRGLDLLLLGCPFRSTFWKEDNIPTAKPDYLETLRGAGKQEVVAYKGARSGHYYSHHIKPEKIIRVVKRVGVSGDLVYIAEPDDSIR